MLRRLRRAIDHRTQKESLNSRWFDYDAHWLTYESLGSLRGDTTNGYAQNSLAVRAGARARYFRYEVTLHQNIAKAGPAFGIRDPDNFFAVTWNRPSEGFRLYKVVDGHKPEVIAYHSTTYTQANRILRIEVTSSGGADYCTVTLDPYTTPVVLFNNVSLAAHGYTGGQFGAYCSFSLTTSAILDDTKLWIDESGGNTFDKLVFNDDFSSASATITLAHDDNGNLTKDGVYEYVYDAWNRLVQVKAGQTGSAGSLFTTYRYDGLGRRVGKAIGHSGDADTTEWYYYSGQRLLETRNGSNQTTHQYVWGTQYIDELVREDINGDPGAQGHENQCVSDELDKAYYYHQDANYNVVAVTGGTGSEAGQVVQRISYTAYGRPTFTDATGRVRCGPSFGPTNTAGQLVAPSSLAIAWQGLPYDLETGLTYNRARMLHHRLGRFMQRDPLGYVDGMSLYQYVGGCPETCVDPSGMEIVFKCVGMTKEECDRAVKKVSKLLEQIQKAKCSNGAMPQIVKDLEELAANPNRRFLIIIDKKRKYNGELAVSPVYARNKKPLTLEEIKAKPRSNGIGLDSEMYFNADWFDPRLGEDGAVRLGHEIHHAASMARGTDNVDDQGPLWEANEIETTRYANELGRAMDPNFKPKKVYGYVSIDKNTGDEIPHFVDVDPPYPPMPPTQPSSAPASGPSSNTTTKPMRG